MTAKPKYLEDVVTSYITRVKGCKITKYNKATRYPTKYIILCKDDTIWRRVYQYVRSGDLFIVINKRYLIIRDVRKLETRFEKI